MKKKLRNLLSLILAIAMVATSLPGAVKAADAQGFKMTGFLEDQVANGHLLVNTSVDFENYGVADLTKCSSSVSYWAGTSAADATQSTWAGTFSFDGGRILFDGFLGSSGINSEYTYVKIAQGTQFVWGEVIFELEEDFVVVKEDDGWRVQFQTFNMTGFLEDQVANGHLLINTSVDFETYGVADLTKCSSSVSYWAGTSAADATQSTWAGTFSFDGGRILFDGFFGSSGISSEYTYVKIEKGTQFLWSNASFELAHDFVLIKESDTWTVQLPTFNITGFLEDQVANGHLLVNTSVDFENYGVADLTKCSSSVSYWAGTSAADATQSTWAGTFSFDGGRILFDGFLGSSGINSEYTYVKIAQGTQFAWSSMSFELEQDFVLVKISDVWTVQTAATDVNTFKMTSFLEDQVANGHLLVNTSVDFENYGVADLTKCSSSVSYWAGTSAADATQSTWAGTFSFDGGRILFDGFLGSSGINSEYTYVKIAQGTQFVWDEVIFELEEDFVVVKEDDGWRVQLPTFNMTGYLEDQVANGHLLINTSVDFATYGVENLTKCSSSVSYWAGTSAADATQSTWAGTFSFDGGRILFDGFFGSSGISSEYTYVKIEKGTQFLWSNASFELAEDFVLAKIDGTWTVTSDADLAVTKVQITGIQSINIYPNVNNLVEMYLQTNVTWTASDTPINLTGENIKISDVDETLVSIRPSTNGIMVFNHFGGASMSQGTVVTIPAGTQFTIGDVTYEIEEDFAFRYDGSTGGTIVGETVSRDVVVDGRTWANSTALFWTTDIPADDLFQGETFTTSDIVIYRGDEVVSIPSFTVHYDNNTDKNTLLLQPEGGYQAGDIVAVLKGGTAVNEEYNYQINFTTACTTKYLGGGNYTDWVDYVEQVQVVGVLSTYDGCMYLETDLGAGHRLVAKDNPGYSTSDITITKADGTAVNILWITVDENNGAICIGYDQSSLTDGTVLFVKADGTAVNAAYDYTMQFTNGCLLKYDADATDSLSGHTGAWVSAYSEVGVAGIYYDVPADGTTGLKTTLYLTLNWSNEDDYTSFAGKSLKSEDIWITRADGTRIEIDSIAIDSNADSKALSVYVAGGFAEGDVLHIKQNGIALHATEAIGLCFTNDFRVYFEEGAWVYDVTGPEFYYDGTVVTDDMTITAKAGQNKSVFESHFYAADLVTGIVDIIFTYSDGALDSNGRLVAGNGYTLTMTADDGHGNVTVRTAALSVEVVINLGDSNNDEIISALDLVALVKAIAVSSADTSLYDLDGDGTVGVNDSASMRAVLVGKYSIVAGQTVNLPTYEGSAVLFADFPTDQTDSTAVTTYFGANFTHMLMTEDSVALTQNSSVNASYLTAMNLIQTHGDVIVRNNQSDGGSFVDKGVTTELADAGANSFYYWDEPTLTELTDGTLDELITWHNTYNSDATFHVNLFPSYATSSDIGSSYATYINTYVDNVLAKVDGKKTLCIDNYPLVNKNTNYVFWTTNEKQLRTNYLSDLLTVANTVKTFNAANPSDPAEVALAIQSYGVSNVKGSTTQRMIESYADITFQTNMAIAMGARTLEYFAYLQKLDAAEQAMITGDGEKTAVYTYVANANAAIKAWDHVFTSYDWQGAQIPGDTSYSFAKASVSADTNTVVSEFKDDYGNYAYMAVNATEPSKGTTVTASLTFTGATQAVVYRNGEASVETLSNGVLSVALGAGEGAFCIPIY